MLRMYGVSYRTCYSWDEGKARAAFESQQLVYLSPLIWQCFIDCNLVLKRKCCACMELAIELDIASMQEKQGQYLKGIILFINLVQFTLTLLSR